MMFVSAKHLMLSLMIEVELICYFFCYLFSLCLTDPVHGPQNVEVVDIRSRQLTLQWEQFVSAAAAVREVLSAAG